MLFSLNKIKTIVSAVAGIFKPETLPQIAVGSARGSLFKKIFQPEELAYVPNKHKAAPSVLSVLLTPEVLTLAPLREAFATQTFYSIFCKPEDCLFTASPQRDTAGFFTRLLQKEELEKTVTLGNTHKGFMARVLSTETLAQGIVNNTQHFRFLREIFKKEKL